MRGHDAMDAECATYLAFLEISHFLLEYGEHRAQRLGHVQGGRGGDGFRLHFRSRRRRC